jgi:hypothetical protein
MDLHEALPTIVPLAVTWAKERSAEILLNGEPLTVGEYELAKRMGVSQPERIRIQMVDRLPRPENPVLAQVAESTGLLGPNMVGLTLGYGLYICRGHRDRSLVSHECRHVFQYEQAGSIDKFLPVYLGQIATYGYENAPLEVDAYGHQVAV